MVKDLLLNTLITYFSWIAFLDSKAKFKNIVCTFGFYVKGVIWGLVEI